MVHSLKLSPQRWSSEEFEKLKQVRERLGPVLSERPQFPDVVGAWRKENGVDLIRESILRGGLNHPKKFPKGDKILSMVPQIVIAPYCCDKTGSPICVDQYKFSPAEVLSAVSIPEYIQFIIHSLEYKTLIVEQLSEEAERAALARLQVEEKEGAAVSPRPYGVLLYTCVIRDLDGVGFEHVGSKGQEIVRAVIGVASANYPELMRKCFMINAPWVFNALWYFIKGLLPARTIAKVSVMGPHFKAAIDSEISPENLPALIGGPYAADDPFEFDLDYFSLVLPLTPADTSASAPGVLGHGHGHDLDGPVAHVVMSGSACVQKVEADLIAFSSEESRRGSADGLDLDTGMVERVGSLQSLKLAEEEEGQAASLRLTESSVVAEFERTGLRNRDGERDRERERERETVCAATAVTAESPRNSSVIVLEEREREREAGPVKPRASLLIRVLSSAIASMAYREAMERERDRSREGGLSYVPCPSVLAMAGWA